jgi:hypothetical protein
MPLDRWLDTMLGTQQVDRDAIAQRGTRIGRPSRDGPALAKNDDLPGHGVNVHYHAEPLHLRIIDRERVRSRLAKQLQLPAFVRHGSRGASHRFALLRQDALSDQVAP